MTQMKRRHFLQLAGSTLASIGLSEMILREKGDRYGKVLAQSTSRKLALLVGINQYPDSPLFGCLTDVELQRELLIHRFGFNPKDILTITDTEATRQGILTAFEEHLVKQAKPGDVVVYHYSGHGAQVYDPDSGYEDKLNSTFVPIDRTSTPATGGQVSVSDIMGATLFLLMSAIQTQNFTAVLDSCHSGGGKRGNLIVRAWPEAVNLTATNILPSPQEREYQQQWLSKLSMNPNQFKQSRQQVAKGVVVASARRDQLAADLPFEGFHAGAFTYALTQYLWQMTGTDQLDSVLTNVTRNTTRIAQTQIPEYEAKSTPKDPIYFLPPSAQPADAVVTKLLGKNQAEIWLGGIDPNALRAFNANAVFNLVDSKGSSQGSLRIESRDKLKGIATLLPGKTTPSLIPGAFLQEGVRTIPEDIALRVGLDTSLGNDSDTAKRELAKIQRVQTVVIGQGAIDYLLGRMTAGQAQQLQKKSIPNIPPVGSIGLFSQGLDEVIPGSFGTPGELIANALTRLTPKFRGLLAVRIVRSLMVNVNASRLPVSTRMKILGNNEAIVASQFTPRGGGIKKSPVGQKSPSVPLPKSISTKDGVVRIPVGQVVQFEVTNSMSSDAYATILYIDSTGLINVLFPSNWTGTQGKGNQDITLIPAGTTRLVPDPVIDNFEVAVDEPLGTTEVLVIVSREPLSSSLKALQAIATRSGTQRGALGVSEDPLKVVNDLVGDLDRGSRGPGGLTPTPSPSYRGLSSRAVSTQSMAAMSITFESVGGV